MNLKMSFSKSRAVAHRCGSLGRRMAALSAILALFAVVGPGVAGAWPRGAALEAPPAGAVWLVRARGAELIMVDDPACRYCRKWDAEVGRGYVRTPEGRAAPLRRVQRGSAVLQSLAPVIYTPTFILVSNGRELGRITGYPGQMFFWEELATLMSSAGVQVKTGG